MNSHDYLITLKATASFQKPQVKVTCVTRSTHAPLRSVWSGFVEGSCPVTLTPVHSLESGKPYTEHVAVHVWMKADGTECKSHRSFGVSEAVTVSF